MNNINIDKDTMTKIEELKLMSVLEDMLYHPSLINLDVSDVEYMFKGKTLFAVIDTQLQKGQEPVINSFGDSLDEVYGLLYFYLPDGTSTDMIEDIIIKIREKIGDIEIAFGLSMSNEVKNIRVAGFFTTCSSIKNA